MREPDPETRGVQAAIPARLGSMIGLAGRQWRRVVDLRLQGFELTQATWAPLLHLARAAGPMRQKELAAALSLDSSSVVRLIDMLAAAGLVERREDAGDRRARAIVVTEAGRRLATRAEGVSRQLERELLGGIASEDEAAARRVLHAICTQLARLAEGEGNE